MNFAGPWHLRCSVQFLEEIAEALYDGGAWLTPDASFPQGLTEAVSDRLLAEHWQVAPIVIPTSNSPPVTVLASHFGVLPSRLALATASLSQHAAVLDLRKLAAERVEIWTDFVESYAQTRRTEGTGLSLLVMARSQAPEALRALSWRARIRRADAGLWADIHAQNDRPEPLGNLVHAIAVELLGWRLDLAQSFMQAGVLDVLDPLGWLGRRLERPAQPEIEFNGRAFACPLALIQKGAQDVLRNRLWRAHLTAIFPWLEEQRQAILERHAGDLEVTDRHRTTLRVEDVADLEISEIARQLRERDLVERHVQEAYNAMGSIRKALAHRKPASPWDLRKALQSVLT